MTVRRDFKLFRVLLRLRGKRASDFSMTSASGNLAAMRMRLVSNLALLLLGIVVAVACGGGGNSASTGDGATKPAGSASGTASKPGGAGALIIAKPSELSEYDLKSGTEKTLLKADTANTFILDPALSPDRKRIAYIVQPPAKVADNKYDAGSDLWVANRDGSDPHAVVLHAQANQLIRFPKWEDDAHILAVVQEISSDAGGITRVVYTLERVLVADGTRAPVLQNVLAFDISPDGKRLIYAKLAPQIGETLNIADITGLNDTPLVGIDQNLSPFNAPRFSPDGTKIAFASADQTGARANQEYVSAAPFGRDPGTPLTTNASAALDGLPEDIWTIDPAGGAPVRVADLKEDLPALTWSGDGKHLYVVGSGGLYDINITSGASTRLGDGVFHGALVWSP